MKIIIYLSMICASVSFTITETQLFQPLRQWIKKKSVFLGKLLSCGYCLGHWVAFALTAAVASAGENILPIIPLHLDPWRFVDYFSTSLVIAWLSGFQWIFMCLLMVKGKK